MAYVPSSGSVVAFQGNPSVLQTLTGLMSTNASVITTGVANQSVSGTIQTQVQGSVATVIIGGSIAASFTPPANQSVSGSVNVSSLMSIPNVISGANSTASALGIGLTFTGTGEEVKDFASITITVFADQASATDGLSLQQSSDNTNWDIIDTYTIPASTGKTFSVQPAARYFRIVYTNGGLLQTAFRLQTIYHKVISKSSSQRPSDGYTNETDLEQNQSFNMVYNGATWDRMRGTTAGTIVTGSVQQGTSPWTVVSSLAGGIFPISGSVAAVVTNFPTNQNVSGSVISFQGGTQVTSLVSTVPSSVLVGASIFGQLPGGTAVLGSVATLQGTNPWIITGSVQATAAANQSVSGTVQTDVRASVAVVIIGGSVATATTNSSVFLLNSPNTIGSVIAYQGLASWNVSGSVAAVQFGTNITSLVSTVPSSVLVGASIFGQVPVTRIANTIPASALAFLGATSSVTANIASTITVLGYSKAILQITSNPSMTGTVTFQGSADNSSWRPLTGYNTDTNALASVTTVADANWVFDVAGLQTFRALLPVWSAGSVTGKVYLSPEDARPQAVYVSNSTPSSLLTGASIIGLPPVNVTNTNLNVGGSVVSFQAGTWSTSVMTNVITSIATAGQVMGSVATLQGTNPWTTNFQNSSILAVPVGSVITVLQGASIVGTYAEDAAHTTGDKGVFGLNVRNDTLSSITSADSDYSPMAVGPTGEVIMANAPLTKWVSGTASMLGGVPMTCSVTVIAAQGASIFTYITGVQVVNFSASSVLVSFGGATSSLIGYTIAPAGGGSNIVYPNGLKTSGNAAFSASVSGTSSVYVTAVGFISKT